jgi:hypothetical protein
VSKAAIIGRIISLAGTALWLYGYLATGNPSLIDWHVDTPWWIADFLPNNESEIGMALVFAGEASALASRWKDGDAGLLQKRNATHDQEEQAASMRAASG